jgi:hypothetical protein
MANGVPQDISTLMYVIIVSTLTLNNLHNLRLHVLLVFVPSSPLLALISGSCLGASFISSTLLVYRHESLENATATRAVRNSLLSLPSCSLHLLFSYLTCTPSAPTGSNSSWFLSYIPYQKHSISGVWLRSAPIGLLYWPDTRASDLPSGSCACAALLCWPSSALPRRPHGRTEIPCFFFVEAKSRTTNPWRRLLLRGFRDGQFSVLIYVVGHDSQRKLSAVLCAKRVSKRLLTFFFLARATEEHGHEGSDSFFSLLFAVGWPTSHPLYHFSLT